MGTYCITLYLVAHLVLAGCTSITVLGTGNQVSVNKGTDIDADAGQKKGLPEQPTQGN